MASGSGCARRLGLACGMAVLVTVPLVSSSATAGATVAASSYASGEMWGVACQPGQCVAVGAAEILTPQAWTLSGGAWSVDTLTPGNASEPWLRGVSCPQAGVCVGVGVTRTGGYAAQLADGSWRNLSLPPGTPALYSVSCVSATWCMAVGDAGSSSTVLEWEGSTWSVLAPLAASSPWLLDTVTCLSTTSCLLGGYSESTPLVESWDGTTWAITTPPAQSLPESYETTDSISCTSASFCLAVDLVHGCCGSFGGTTMSWNGSTWTDVPMSTALYGAILNSVACTSPTSCLVVGVVTPADTQHFAPYAVVGRWNGTKLVQLGGAAAGLASSLSGVSCTRPDWCAAVGSFTPRKGPDLPLVERWNGSRLARMFAAA